MVQYEGEDNVLTLRTVPKIWTPTFIPPGPNIVKYLDPLNKYA